ncbi:hypothetical protein BGX30_002586 [Mortierella sp. GBA39]|nr:hypothetical protein BGX30_002586 [Mortierella sp. GBA39]
MPARPHALDLPEILPFITQHLTPKDLYACIRVSHAFHHAFIPHLWSTILIKPPQKPKHLFLIPPKQALTRHQHLIRGLHLINTFPPHYLTAFRGTLQELHISTLRYRRFDPRDHEENLRRLMGVILANAGSLRDLSVRVAVPKERQWVVNKEVWEAVRRCRRVRTLEVSYLDVSLRELEAFWEICGGDTEALTRVLIAAGIVPVRHPKTERQPPPPLPPLTSTTTTMCSIRHPKIGRRPPPPPPLIKTTRSTPSRSVELDMCTFDEWPDEVYADDSLTLPAITTLKLTSVFNPSARGPTRISVFGQARMIRKCVNLRCFQWSGGDSLSDAARSERLNLRNGDDVAWFFGGLLGDTPCLRGKYGWKTAEDGNDEAEEDKGRPGERWPLPHLESIKTTWKDVPDLVIARLLKRLHRLTSLQLSSPNFGPLAFRELVQERVPFRAMPIDHQPRDPSFPFSASPRLVSPPPRRLSTSIRVLDISSYSSLTSDNVFELLESCPVLEDFSAAIVNMTGILKRTTDWACHKMKHISLVIVFNNPASSPTTTTTTTTTWEAQKAVYAQLARLRNLKTFERSYVSYPPDTLELQLNLAHGLDLLSTWGESIEYIKGVCNIQQSMSLEDIQWMLDHWPKLKNMFCSKFHPDAEVDRQIRELLRSRGVALCSPQGLS